MCEWRLSGCLLSRRREVFHDEQRCADVRLKRRVGNRGRLREPGVCEWRLSGCLLSRLPKVQQQGSGDLHLIRDMANVGHDLSVLLQRQYVSVRWGMQCQRRQEVRARKHNAIPGMYKQLHVG